MSSPESTPHRRKRQRLSSPTYDEQIPLSQHEVAAFDTFEHTLSQGSKKSSPLKPSQSLSSSGRARRDELIAAAMGLKKINTDENVENIRGSSGSSTLSTSSGRKENRQPSRPDRAYSPSHSRTASPATSPLSPSKHSVRSPKRKSGFMSAASLGNPFTNDSPPTSPSRKRVSGFTSALQAEHREDSSSPKGKRSMPGFASALSLKESTPLDDFPSSSPTAPPEKSEQELADWFQSSDLSTGAIGFTSAKTIATVVEEEDWFKLDAKPTGFAGFQSAKALKLTGTTSVAEATTDVESNNSTTMESTVLSEKGKAPETVGFVPPAFTGFTTGKTLLDPTAPAKIAYIAPSEAALQKAAAMMNQWEKEIDKEFSLSTEEEEPPLVVGILPNQTYSQNFSGDVPQSPSPAGPALRRPLGFGTASGTMTANEKKPFKSPLLAAPPTTPFRPPLASSSKSAPVVSSPLNPKRFAPYTTPARQTTPFTPYLGASSAFNTPLFPSTPMYLSSSPSTPRSLGMSARKVSGGSMKKPFSTPFKPGLKPGETGRLLLEQQQKASSPVRIIGSGSSGRPSTSSTRKSNGKIPLASSGLVPQSYTRSELQSMGLSDFNELSRVTPATAFYYSFHSASPFPLRHSQLMAKTMTLGSSSAYSQLRKSGYSLVTREWIDNHWCLILWKLAGLAALEPQRERNPDTKRWCWDEIIRQLTYRYDREINGTSRPALRLITTHDAPASCPMVLVVTNILRPDDDIPELEISDGWYRLRAQIDEPLARAIKKGAIKIGRKIAVTGCRLEMSGKEPADILDAYDTVMLKISGNSSHLAPWHAKLGFQASPFISSLRSIGPDGGMVAVIDVVVEKVYPIAFMETIEDEEGNRQMEGPRNEEDELAEFEKWKARRELEADKLRSAFQKEIQKWEIWLERLEQRADSRLMPSVNESVPEHIEDLMVELEDLTEANNIFRCLSIKDSGWLLQLMQQKVNKDRQTFYDGMERELDNACPPRDVRSFRVIIVKDAQPGTGKYPAGRTGQITIWDVLNYRVSEDAAPGSFTEGQTIHDDEPCTHS
ncbi:hypothetical protein QCA50_002252 [Cerrena zonata]|uniref:BRCA2 OB1 domain-containing protein n=1 Tax=Cerrena zonata TaxID=2478898 RepID=A0AAW0GNV7_9APHY